MFIAGIVVSLRWAAGIASGTDYQVSSNCKETKMNWDRIEDNWKKIKGNNVEQWGDLHEEPNDSQTHETPGNS